MRLILVSQILAAAIASIVMSVLGVPADAIAVAYGALIGLTITLLTRRSTDRALQAAIDNPTHGVATMFSGFVLRYAVAILGLLVGFRVLQLSAEPMIAGFVLMIVVQTLVAAFVRPQSKNREA